MKLLYAVAASMIASLGHGSPYPSFVERQAPGSYYAITGATGGVHQRLEIRELQKNGEMFNLFLLALTEFQAIDQNQIDSYFQIAGIHGQPWQDWDGVATTHATPPPRGYCPHGQTLFLQWHRPYLALFEQKLQSIAINIAGRFTGAARTRYQNLATQLRLPYWDWATATPANIAVIPAALTSQTVQVTLPDNSNTQIDNPLFDYNFHPKPSTLNSTGCSVANGGLLNYGNLCDFGERTVRAPSGGDIHNSNHVDAEKNVRFRLKSIRASLFNALSRELEYDTFSNGGLCGPRHPEGSFHIEGSHNTIHTEMGPGHMVPIASSAFDPMFWLHHANVDRYMAIWQAMNPQKWMQQCTTAGSFTWTQKLGDVQDQNTPLHPFHSNTAGQFWTSAGIRNIATFSYTYPELVGTPTKAQLVSYVSKAYSGPHTVVPVAKRQEAKPSALKSYAASVQISNVGIPYNVDLFLGNVSGPVGDWAGLDSYAGVASTLGAHNDKSVQTAAVDISSSIEEKIEAGETTSEGAVDYLLQNLKWRISLSGVELSREDIPGVKVTLYTRDIVKAKSESEFDQHVNPKEEGLVDV